MNEIDQCTKSISETIKQHIAVVNKRTTKAPSAKKLDTIVIIISAPKILFLCVSNCRETSSSVSFTFPFALNSSF